MHNKPHWNIKQIIPAQEGWKAVYFAAPEGGRLIMRHRSIICWALVERVGAGGDGLMEVRGMEHGDDGLNVVDDAVVEKGNGDSTLGNQYFLGYDDPKAHHESEYWIAEANRRLRLDGNLAR